MTIPENGCFSIELSGEDVKDEKKMEDLNQFMSAYQDEYIKYVQDFAKEHNMSDRCAEHVLYLRSRSRWTQELENELIELHKKGTPPDIFEYGN